MKCKIKCYIIPQSQLKRFNFKVWVTKTNALTTERKKTSALQTVFHLNVLRAIHDTDDPLGFDSRCHEQESFMGEPRAITDFEIQARSTDKLSRKSLKNK